jgi:hypothetical protein
MLVTWLLCWQDPVTYSYPEPDQSIPRPAIRFLLRSILTLSTHLCLIKSSKWSLTLLNPMLHIYRCHIKRSDNQSTYFLLLMLPASSLQTKALIAIAALIYSTETFSFSGESRIGVGYLPFYERSNHCGCNLDRTKLFLYWIISNFVVLSYCIVLYYLLRLTLIT